VINILSAYFAQLYSDESYYVLFSKQLAFGYFDHPPMIALMVRCGSIFFEDELGVRIFSVIAVSLALVLTFRMAETQNTFLFLTAILSIFGLNILGFLALPDSPLLLFTAAFFFIYKKFLFRETLLNSIILGFTMAALLYSKYQGILILLFTLLSNIKLLRSGKFYLALLTGLLIFMPHIIWQVKNNFVTVFFHLFERSASHYEFSFTYEYIIGQILYYGPLTSVFMFYIAIRIKVSNLFDKALVWNSLGIIAFFLLLSLKGRVEVNWTFPIIVPLLVLFLKFSVSNSTLIRWFYYLAYPLIILILMVRFELVNPVFDIRSSRLNDLQGHKEFGKDVLCLSHGLPVITNSYQMAGLLSFYTDMFIPSININSRRNQFNLWHADDSLRYKKVAFVNNYLENGIKIDNPSHRGYQVSILDSLPVMNDITISVLIENSEVYKNGIVNAIVILKGDKPSENYKDAGRFITRLSACVYKDENLLSEVICDLPVNQILDNYRGQHIFVLKAPSGSGKYSIVISLNTSGLGTWSTKKTLPFTVI
jgi:hypothetical protein